MNISPRNIILTVLRTLCAKKKNNENTKNLQTTYIIVIRYCSLPCYLLYHYIIIILCNRCTILCIISSILNYYSTTYYILCDLFICFLEARNSIVLEF